MTLESDAFLRSIKGWKQMAWGSHRVKSFDLSGQTCFLVTSGMGSQRASEAAITLVQMAAPRMLVSFGIAGAVEADLQIGDVIAAEAVCRLEQGFPGPLMPLASWSEAAQNAAVRALAQRGARLFSGTAVTTGGSQVEKEKLENIKRPVLEMETAGISQVASRNGIPVLSLRAISDGPNDPIPFDLGEIMDTDANLQAGRILRKLVSHPGVVFQSRRLMRNSRIAAGNAAIALFAALGAA